MQEINRDLGTEIIDAREAPEANIAAMVAYRRTHNVEVVFSDTGETKGGEDGANAPWVWGKPWLITYRTLPE